MDIEVNWKVCLNFRNPFRPLRLDEVHDYVWEGDDDDDLDAV
jgi:hypothetical protein